MCVIGIFGKEIKITIIEFMRKVIMIKVLFLINDLGQGGAEKVMVNLVNNMDQKKFDITVTALFGGGVNERFLRPEIHYKAIFSKVIPGNSHIMKLFTPKMLHKFLVKEEYDIEISYLEGVAARIISGCQNKNTKLVAWVHCTMNTQSDITESFRNIVEAESCYNKMNKMIFVSEDVRKSFLDKCNYRGNTEVLYNTVESDKIIKMSQEDVREVDHEKIGLISVGSLKPIKGFIRLMRIVKKLQEEEYPIHLYILGAGPQRKEIEQFIIDNSLSETVSLLGYQTNPYKYVAKCSLFVCSSLSEGFSTAVTEALIVGTPVCTVDVSGMKELLGKKNEFGVVTENTEEALYQGVKKLISNPQILNGYRNRAEERGKIFNTSSTVKAVEKFFQSLVNN